MKIKTAWQVNDISLMEDVVAIIDAMIEKTKRRRQEYVNHAGSLAGAIKKLEIAPGAILDQRFVMAAFAVSYSTADRILTLLEECGMLQRVAIKSRKPEGKANTPPEAPAPSPPPVAPPAPKPSPAWVVDPPTTQVLELLRSIDDRLRRLEVAVLTMADGYIKQASEQGERATVVRTIMLTRRRREGTGRLEKERKEGEPDDGEKKEDNAGEEE